MGGQLHSQTSGWTLKKTTFCYIQLKRSLRFLQPPALICTKSLPFPACTSSSYSARFVPVSNRKSSHHAHFCTAHVSKTAVKPGGRLARLLDLGCLSASSQHNFNGSTYRRLIRRHCRDADRIILLSAKTKCENKIKIDKNRWIRIFFQRNTSSLTLLIAGLILADKISLALLRSEW